MATVISLVNFDGQGPGQMPIAALTADAAENLFGTTANGGAYGGGIAFELVNNGGSYTFITLASFNFGLFPEGNLIADAAGNLFGTTYGGGSTNGDGTVFEIPRTSTGYASTPITLVSFNGTNGAGPIAGLTADAAGNLFGTTAFGGAYGVGTVFEIPKTSTGYASTPITLANFNGTNGNYPSSTLIADTAGNLFGTAQNGGANGDGTVFELVNNGGSYTFTTLVDFNYTNGFDPAGGLIADAAGNLFGTTASAGAYGRGTVFEIPKTSTGYANTPTTLVSFDSGLGPKAGLTADAIGNLFGVTLSGTIFELVNEGQGNYSFTTLATVGGNPQSTLIADTAGNLFGTAPNGGPNGYGSVFEITGSGFIGALRPIVKPDRAHVDLHQTISVSAAGGVLANDTDPLPDDTLIVSAVDGNTANVGHPVWGKYGILTLNGGGGYGYVATNGRLALPASGVGVDSFTYTARNGLGVTATTSLTIIVTEQRKNYVGGTADTTIDGLKGHGSVLDGGAGNDVLVSGAAQTVLLGGPGDTLIGGSGPDTFLFPADFGHETIQNFNVHNDRIALQLSVFANFAAVMADTHQLGPNTVIGHDANTITLDNMNLSQLHASQFSFVS